MRCWCSRRLASSWLDAFAHRDELVLGHQFGDRLARIGREAHVAVGQNADELAGLAVAAALDHRDAGNAVVPSSASSASASVASGIDGERIDHHAGFEFLDLADLRGLLAPARDCGG